MHGATKSDLTPERIKLINDNIKKYKKLNSFILSQKKCKIYNEEMLEKCNKILTINSEHYTVWNYRREILLYLFENDFKTNQDEQGRLLLNELSTISSTLHRNPKSYSSFHHRFWCIKQDKFNKIDLNKELKLCSDFLSLDSRNFHCWDYRRFIVSQSGSRSNNNIKLKDELKYSKELIEQNFSNYSAWHYRSTLIPLICKNNDKKLKKRINRELKWVKNAFYTEPNDQSAWLYHRWLLGKDGYSTMIRLKQNKIKQNMNIQSNVHQYQLTIQELINEYNEIEQFLKVEPKSKWGLLTFCVLIQAIKARDDHTDNNVIDNAKDKVEKTFETLIMIDEIRKNYYLDVKDQLIKQLTDNEK